MTGTISAQERGSPCLREPASLVELLGRRAATHSDWTAYVFLPDGEAEGARLTYYELWLEAVAIGAELQRRAPSGERALLLYPSGREFVAAFFGCLCAGIIAVPVYPPDRSRPDKASSRLRAIARDAQPSIVLTLSSLMEAAQAAGVGCPEFESVPWLATDGISATAAKECDAPAIRSDTPAFIQYTSGSTAAPRGVIVTHENILHNERLIQAACGHTEESTFVSWLPLYHDMGLIGTLLQPLYVGARGVIMPPQAFLEKPVRWLQAITRYKAATSGGPNFAYELCVRKITSEQRDTLDLRSWTTAFNGAEPVRCSTLERFSTAFEASGFSREAFFPCYGLAEATLIVSGSREGKGPNARKFIASALERNQVTTARTETESTRTIASSGAILGGQRVVIVNPESLVECPPNEVGEVWLSGPSVAVGYWNEAAETERVFNAFLSDAGEGPFLRTGDLGFLLEGELFITGRIKDLIIIRGRNHYPQDIEQTVEVAHPALRLGCGAAFSIDDGAEERLVIVHEVDDRRLPDSAAIFESIRQEVAEGHELAVDAIALIKPGSIPKTSSGKVQRRVCRVAFLEESLPVVAQWRAPVEVRDKASLAAIEALGSDESIESQLVVWLAERLKVTTAEIRAGRSIAACGLDSLTAASLAHEIEDALRVRLPLSSLLRMNVAQLARRVRLELEAGDEVSNETHVAAEVGSEVESGAPQDDEFTEFGLSAGQRALWFLQQLDPESTAYNISSAVRISGLLDSERLSQAFQALTDRHESLRATFVTTVDGEPAQRIRHRAAACFREKDASGWNEDLLNDHLTEEAHRPFDLVSGPLFRVTLFTRSPRLHVLLVSAHHIIVDFWSLAILIDELVRLYVSGRGSCARSPASRRSSYADFVRRQSQLLNGPEGDRLWSYWRGKLAGDLPVLNLPTDRPRPAIPASSGASVPVNLTGEIMLRIGSLSRSSDASVHSILLAAFESLLHRYTMQDEIAVGCPATGRSRAEWRDVVGYFVNPVVIRADFSSDPSFDLLLAQVKDDVLAALDHQDYPFALLVERLQPQRDPSRSPLFQAMMAFNKSHLVDNAGIALFAVGEAEATVNVGDLEFQAMPLGRRAVQFELSLIVAEANDRVAAVMEYRTDLFEHDTLVRLSRHFENLLQSALREPRRRVSDLVFLSESEQWQVLAEWNRPVEYGRDDGLLQDAFEAQARRTPHSIAAAHGLAQVTYAELNGRANKLARCLRRAGIGPERQAAIFIERGIEMMLAMLGVIKSGAAFVPVDPAYPRERQAVILEDARIEVLLTLNRLVDLLPNHQLKLIRLDKDWSKIATVADHNLGGVVSPENLAYVLYTSGSTGRPKGVALCHRGARALLDWASREYAREDLAGVLAATSICFDLSIFEIMAPLAAGGRVVLVENALGFAECESAHYVTLINTVPSAMAEIIGGGQLPDSLRIVNLAGEPLSKELVQSTYKRSKVERVMNLYGPTEDTTYSTGIEIAKTAVDDPTIGRPIGNRLALILGRGMQSLSIGIPGEMCLGGEGLARGYLNNPDLTAERFVPDPFSATAGSRLYRTGDLARYKRDGRLEFLARIDHQVKLRGFRIEIGEIESALRRNPSVRECVVESRELGPGDKGLVAYVVGYEREEIGIGGLREALEAVLPGYMVPSAFVLLESLPRTPNGKIDRQKLPAPNPPCAERAESFIQPRNPIEELLAEVWADAFGVEKIDVRDNFFDLGGHSLLAARIVSRVQRNLSVGLPLRKIFECPTIADLSEAIGTMLEGTPRSQLPPIRRTENRAELPLSFAQRRVWFIDQLDPGNPVYHIPLAVRFRGALALDALEQAINGIVTRHEALRATFSVVDGRPCQSFQASSRFALCLVDLAALPELSRDLKATRLATEESRRPFDLTRGPLLRAALIRVDADDHLAVFTFHHIAADGWSLEVFGRELSVLFEGFSRGVPVHLPDLSVRYSDFVQWQWERAEAGNQGADLSYWKEQLRGASPVIELRADRARPAVQTFRGAVESFELSTERTQLLKELGRRNGVTAFMTFVAAFSVLLRRYTRCDDIIIGTPAANRGRAELEPLIGFFSNMLVLRTEVSGSLDFVGLAERVRDAVIGAYAHQDLTFERLVEELQQERSLSHSPLFQVAMAFHTDPVESVAFPGLDQTWEPIHTGTSKFDLQLNILEKAGRFVGAVEYSTDLFEPTTIARMADHIRTLLQNIAANPRLTVSALSLLTDSERRRVLYERNNAGEHFGRNQNIHQAFELSVEQYSDAIGVSFEERHVSYQSLNAASNQLAHDLIALGIEPEARVGILLDRSPEMIAAILAVLKAGGAYVPLDPAYPKRRLELVLEDSGSQVLITRKGFVESISTGGRRVIDLDSEREAIRWFSDKNPVRIVEPDSAAYVIYTSGSTGRPKGVVVSHRNVTRLFEATAEWFMFGEADVWTQFHSYAFDFSVWEILGALIHGGRLVIAPYLVTRSPEAFYEMLLAERVTVLNQTPSAFRQLMTARADVRSKEIGLRLVVFGGEALDPAGLRGWLEEPGNAHVELVNMFGITETTVHVTYRRIAREDVTNGRSPIGQAIPDLQLGLLDEDMQPSPDGVAGEICVGGPGLARGYLNRPDITAESFVPNPHSRGAGARLYRSGDLGRYFGDADIEYLGRKDEQVKIRGYRIELGEVESAVCEHESVAECKAIVDRTTGEPRLIAYVVPVDGNGAREVEIRRRLREQLPEYMIPAAFVSLDQMPLTANGKLDRRALPLPDGLRPALDPPYVEPRTETEKAIAGVWQQVLRLEKVGAHDNFFDLGGNSLLMAQACGRLKDTLDRDLSMVEAFTYTTVSALAGFLVDRRATRPVLPHTRAEVETRLESMKRREAFRRRHRAKS